MLKKPELLAPAGNYSKFLTAMRFGADAVYIGGKNFSLRAFSDNFTEDEMKKAVEYAHSLGRKVYVTVNIFARNADIEKAEEKNLVCARRVFLENERKWINNETSKFSVLWTLKESVMKALGEGFALAPKDFDVMPFLDNKSITVGETELWAYTAVYDGYSVSLCLSNEPKNKFEGIEIVRIK